jgi:hypothetical protein
LYSQIKCFDPTTGKQKIITAILDQGVLNDPANGNQDTYIKLSITGRTIAGDIINPFVISGESDLVLGTTQYDGVTTDNYSDLGAAVDDYVLRIVQGVPGDATTKLDFNS